MHCLHPSSKRNSECQEKMKTCIVLGGNSDIFKGLREFLQNDYIIATWKRDDPVPTCQWDLVLCMLGSVAPVGLWHSVDEDEWNSAFVSNLLLPFHLLRELWPYHNQNASVCMMAGSNPNMVMSGYSGYHCSKMALLKLVEQLDHETPDAKFFALGPGTILTKIHKASEGWDNPKLKKAIEEGKQANYKRLYECLKWCTEQEKHIVGGRNICVSDDLPTASKETIEYAFGHSSDLFKLRRHGG